MSPRVSTSWAGERIVYHLHDDASGASASILPSYGFNLFDLRLPVNGEVRAVVASEPGFAENPSRPARNGFPILFPFPGRIRDARFTFAGIAYELAPNKPPHAIHGFAHEANWDVIEHGVEHGSATLIGRFQISRNAPEALHRWPADAILEITYRLAGSKLTLDASVTNPTERPLPWGFGLHSYFRFPFDGREDRSTTRLVVDASEFWVLSDSLPTGERRPVDGTPLDYRRGLSMADLLADDALTGLSSDPNGNARLIDEALGAELRLTYGNTIREMVIFTPSGSAGIVAVEPYTQMADGFSLRDRGIDAGMRILAPGESDELELSFESIPIELG
ncbi:MAG: galM [Planctomycetota bacterium]|nr:galM [Planctomycetota bacterium]